MAGLSGSGASVGVDLVYEVVRGLNGVAKIFERLEMVSRFRFRVSTRRVRLAFADAFPPYSSISLFASRRRI